MEAPKGIEINAEAGSLKATCRTELRLESKDGEVSEKRQALQQSQAEAWIPCSSGALWVTTLLRLRCWDESSGAEGSPDFSAAHSG